MEPGQGRETGAGVFLPLCLFLILNCGVNISGPGAAQVMAEGVRTVCWNCCRSCVSGHAVPTGRPEQERGTRIRCCDDSRMGLRHAMGIPILNKMLDAVLHAVRDSVGPVDGSRKSPQR
ncbi:unnamed protein product [Ostreobium quekettii]|uniref:Uncharacterized protein n=1 Tax=Ostreobium quekettii TaxID=121088 RepID=A0A8S1J2A1_9CHLO|nr:unnamed protein product [Ostreobium quekettii]